MNEFIILHQGGRKVAIRKSMIEAFKDHLIRLSQRDHYFEYTIDESFEEIKKEMGE